MAPKLKYTRQIGWSIGLGQFPGLRVVLSGETMTTHTFRPPHYHTTIGSHAPVLTVADGDTVSTTTVDAGGQDAAASRSPRPATR